jgi:hypothetical protein
MIRKELDYFTEYIKRNEYKTNEPSDNALLTGKKLYPLSCLSCYSSTGTRTKNNHRTLRSPFIDQSVDIGDMSNIAG